MCPSYMATRDEQHSTRGRAHLLFEMLRGETITGGWESDEVKRALDLCLACKACKSECPVSVDMATYKAEFLSHYYETRRRPRQAWSMGRIGEWAPIASRFSGFTNLLSNTAFAKRVAGVDSTRKLPKFAPRSFRSQFKPGRIGTGGETRVVLFDDTFNNHFRPGTAAAAQKLLEAAGCAVELPARETRLKAALERVLPEYDFILIDCRDFPPDDVSTLAEKLCHRRLGIGADQLLLLFPSTVADFRMRIVNADGSEVEMCGNGVRCFAKYVWDRGLSSKDTISIETLAGIIKPEKRNDLIRVDMGEPILDPSRIPVEAGKDEAYLTRVVDYPLLIDDMLFKITCVSMGNPHAVIVVDSVSTFPVAYFGPMIENHHMFPKRTNVEFIERRRFGREGRYIAEPRCAAGGGRTGSQWRRGQWLLQ